jgi:hypothetical protein
MKLPSLIEINLENTAVSRKQMYRTTAIIQFPQIRIIDGSEVFKEEKMRAEVFFGRNS